MDEFIGAMCMVILIIAFVAVLVVIVGMTVLFIQITGIFSKPARKKSLRSLFVPGAGGDMSQVWAEQRRQALAQDQQFQQGVSYRGLYFITGESGTGSEGNSGPGFSGPDMGGGFGGGGFDQGF